MALLEVKESGCVWGLRDKGLPLGQHLFVASPSRLFGTGVEDTVDLFHELFHLWVGLRIICSISLFGILAHILQSVEEALVTEDSLREMPDR